jgi:hypothetical protein
LRGDDKIIPLYVCNKPDMVRFPDRIGLKHRFHLDRSGGLVWGIDGSKANEGIDAGVYSYGTRKRLTSVFGSTPWYFRLMCMLFRLVQQNIDRD